MFYFNCFYYTLHKKWVKEMDRSEYKDYKQKPQDAGILVQGALPMGALHLHIEERLSMDIQVCGLAGK